MERVEEFETEQEVIRNRMIIRKYLKELTINNKRIHMIIKPEFNEEL